MSKQKVRVGPYVSETVQAGETLHAIGEIHWAIFVAPVLGAILATLALIKFHAWAGPVLSIEGLWILLFTIPWISLVNPTIDFYSTESAVTSRRVLKKTGYISRNADEISISKVETVRVNQGIIGRFFGFGTVQVLGTGGHGLSIRGIRDPMYFREILQQVLAT